MKIPWVEILVVINLLFSISIYWKLYKKKAFFSWRNKKKNIDISDYETFVHQLSHALKWMSNHKIGALIVVEKEIKLNKYIDLGYKLTAKFSAELLIAIFSNKNSALHDGGAVIRGLNIVSLASYFPVTQAKLITTMGARHRAAIGLTENSDAISFVVSETNGKISCTHDGKIKPIDGDINSMSAEIFKLLDFYIN